jgi:hypothetical protein
LRHSHVTVSGPHYQARSPQTHSDLSSLAFGKRYLRVIAEAVLAPKFVGHLSECLFKVCYIRHSIVPPTGFFSNTSHVIVGVLEPLVEPPATGKD